MNTFSEKTSKIKVLSLLVLAITFALSSLVGCTESENNSEVSDAISADSSAIVSTSDSSNAESTYEVSGESNASVDESLDASANESTDVSIDASAEESLEESLDESIDESTDESVDESIEESIEPEIVGTGTKDDPYLMIPGEDKMVETYVIPAGESQFYAIYRVGGTILTIENENAMVEYDGIPYVAKKGKVTIEIEYALASDAILFEIFNDGDSDETYLLQFVHPEGTIGNPKKVENISTDNEISIPAGNETGYHFKYIAEKSGKLHFYMESSVPAVLSVTNNATSANRTSDETDAEYVEIEVSAGDELIIVVGAQRDKRNKVPAVDIIWNAVYA